MYVRGAAVTTDPAFGTPTSIYSNVTKISDARDGLDGTSDLDQGIAPVTRAGPGGSGLASNIFPADDSNGLAFSRTTGQVLNIVYLTRAAATMGGFFSERREWRDQRQHRQLIQGYRSCTTNSRS